MNRKSPATYVNGEGSLFSGHFPGCLKPSGVEQSHLPVTYFMGGFRGQVVLACDSEAPGSSRGGGGCGSSCARAGLAHRCE